MITAINNKKPGREDSIKGPSVIAEKQIREQVWRVQGRAGHKQEREQNIVESPALELSLSLRQWHDNYL